MAPPPIDNWDDQTREEISEKFEVVSWAIHYNRAINLYAGFPLHSGEADREFDTDHRLHATPSC